MSLAEALLEDGLGYLDRGWSCVPVRIDGDEKKPTVSWKKRQTVLPTPAELRHCFERRSVNGIAIVTGPASGRLAIRDFDSVPAYQRWCAGHPSLARELPTVRTVDGFHVYAESDHHKVVPLSDGEYRGGPGITVAPRSVRGDFKYHWVHPLPRKGPLPLVEHRLLIGEDVAENAECHCSAVSAFSATSSSTSLSPSAVSAFSAFSATCEPDFVVLGTQPQVVGERNAKLLSLARGLKFNAGLAGADMATLRTLVVQWHRKALPVIGTKDFDTTWADFLHAWEHARHGLGANVLDEVAARVDPNELPEVAAHYTNESVRRLIALCAGLASLNGAKRFFLSAKCAADRIGVDSVQAWRWLKMLEHDRVLRVLERGTKRRATRYRFLATLPGEGAADE